MSKFYPNDYNRYKIDYLIHRQVLVRLKIPNGKTHEGILKYGINNDYLLEVKENKHYIQLIPLKKDYVYDKLLNWQHSHQVESLPLADEIINALEWGATNTLGDPYCLICENLMTKNHTTDCLIEQYRNTKSIDISKGARNAG